MRRMAVATALALSVLPVLGAATEANRAVTITSVHPVAANRPSIPSTQNIIRIYFVGAPFGALSCRADAADISVEDWHVYSTVMSGWRDGKTITLYVDDSVHLVPGDATCGVVAARVE